MQNPKIHKIRRLGLENDIYRNEQDINENNEASGIVIKQIIGPRDVFRNNTYIWRAVIESESSNNFFNQKKQLN